MLLSSAPFGIGVAGAASNDGDDVQGGEELMLVAIDGNNSASRWSGMVRRKSSNRDFLLHWTASYLDCTIRIHL